jgi:hypothetical protein
MNCRDFENIVLDLARDRPLDTATREQCSAHTEVCDRCAARLAEERALLACVRAAVAELAGEGAPARVEATLLDAFRAQRAATSSPAAILPSGGIRHWSSWRTAAVAAGILLLISVIAIFWRPASSPKPQREESALLPGPVSTPGTRATPPQLAVPPVGHDRVVARRPESTRKRARRRVVRDNSRDSSDDAEEVAVFFLLRKGDDLSALGSLRVVRVELPGSALSEVGLAVDPEMAKAPVEADVLLGQDGLARAIRFVR